MLDSRLRWVSTSSFSFFPFDFGDRKGGGLDDDLTHSDNHTRLVRVWLWCVLGDVTLTHLFLSTFERSIISSSPVTAIISTSFIDCGQHKSLTENRVCECVLVVRNLRSGQ